MAVDTGDSLLGHGAPLESPTVLLMARSASMLDSVGGRLMGIMAGYACHPVGVRTGEEFVVRFIMFDKTHTWRDKLLLAANMAPAARGATSIDSDVFRLFALGMLCAGTVTLLAVHTREYPCADKPFQPVLMPLG